MEKDSTPADTHEKALAINLDKPHNPFMAHCCGEQGNRFKLMYFWKHGRLPPGGSVK